MSQKNSNEPNRVIRYQKPASSGNKIKSGILERHTYKTDNGELLPGTSCEMNTRSSNGSDLSNLCTLIQKESLSFRIPKANEDKPAKIIYKQRRLSQNKHTNRNTVRTEDCDSTTDVDLVSKTIKVQTKDEENEVYNSDSRVLKSVKMEDDSDSDCQIIEISKDAESQIAKRKAILKQKILSSAKSSKILTWMILSGKTNKLPYTTESVHIISDSESDESEVPCESVQINRLTSSFVDKSHINNSSVTKEAQNSDFKTDQNYSEPSVYEISDDIKIVLPAKQCNINQELSVINKNNMTPPKEEPEKEIINYSLPKVYVKPFNKSNQNYESDDSSAVSSSGNQNNENYYKENTNEREKIKINISSPSSSKYQKQDLTLSPESMKSEFYSYLKINTNPLAQKTETIHQNRRSVRVRNLIVQNEKLKELNDLKIEAEQKQNNNDVRKKFLKYSKLHLQFPKPPLEHKEFVNFDETIQKYFNEEGILYLNDEDDLPLKLSSKQKNGSLETEDKYMNSYRRKLIYKKIFMKTNCKERKIKQKNKENVFVKKKLLKTKTLLKKSKTNRILRNRRLTRHTLALENYKDLSKRILRTPKIKIKPFRKKDVKIKNKIIKNTEPEITRNESSCSPDENQTNTTHNDLNFPINSQNISPLDELDVVTKNYMEENPEYNNDELSMSVDKKPEKPRSSPTDNCLGFKTSNEINEIRKKFGLVINEMISDINRVNKVITEDDRLKTEIKYTHSESDDYENYYETKLSPNHCVSPELLNSETIKFDKNNYIPLNPNVKSKSFHQSLLYTPTKRKSNEHTPKLNPLNSINIFSASDTSDSDSESEKSIKKKSRTHEIDINKYNGPVFNAYYVNCTLIIVQELLISFWKQTPLGNILGAQNMWYSIGNIKRIMLERGCVNRRSSEMVLNVDSAIAYVELWTKEHQSDFRESPVADVFATVYFHKGQGTPDKKVLQLENIKGYGKDVRFAVMKNSREIIVSWYDTYSKPAKTIIRSYQLAADFQTISSTKEMESVEDYLLSLHNIGNCDMLLVGAGTDQIFVWELAHGWLSTTVNLSVEPPLQVHSMCLWAQCETGYLFLLQQIGSGMLRLIAINGVSSQWKQLQIYPVPKCYENLLGVTIESGVLMTCYTNGFLCYDMQSGELLADTETPINRIILPSEKFLVSIYNYQVAVKHVMAYVLEN